MNTRLQTVSRPPPAPSFTPVRSRFLQRCEGSSRCPDEDEREKFRTGQLALQRRAAGLAEPSTIPPIVEEVLRSPGRPLDPATRAFMEPRFGHDFGRVRVHTDAKAAESARAINALAYTVSNHIFFDTGRWAPATPVGRELLAHELAHTIHQSRVPSIPPAQPQHILASMQVGPSTDPAEGEAQSAALQAAYGPAAPPLPATVASTNRRLLLQRRTVLRDYATAAYETGPIWDVTLTVSGAPDGDSENVDDFINACMDGIRGAAESLGSGRGVRSRHMRVRMRYRRGFDYVTIEQQAFAAARRSVLPERPRRAAQQPPQPQPAAPPAPAAQPAPPRAKTVIVVGSPSPGQAYGLQFVNAALCHGNDADTIWLVEHSGYAMIYGTTPRVITDQAPAGGYSWITPTANLVGWLNSRPDRSIGRLVVYSHGVPGLVALRYGWSSVGMPDYGLNLTDVARLRPSKFTPTATIEFNSCSTGVDGGGNLAQAFADQARRPVKAWTGRTSYAGINRGTCRVTGSTYSLSTDAITEFWRRWQAGTAPRFRTFAPRGGTTP